MMRLTRPPPPPFNPHACPAQKAGGVAASAGEGVADTAAAAGEGAAYTAGAAVGATKARRGIDGHGGEGMDTGQDCQARP